MVEEVEDGGAVLAEQTGDVFRVVLGDLAYHGDALLALLPLSLDVLVELLQQGLVELGRRQQALVGRDGVLWLTTFHC